jgi:hypothetical protein
LAQEAQVLKMLVLKMLVLKMLVEVEVEVEAWSFHLMTRVHQKRGLQAMPRTDRESESRPARR